MILRRKLLLVFALTVCVSVVAVGGVTSWLTRRAFEKSNEERSAALVAQFRREFNRRGDDVVRRLETIASSEIATHMALALTRGSPDYGAYLEQAKIVAENQQLDFLEFTDGHGIIIASAQWPAKFGYKEPLVPLSSVPRQSFLINEGLANGASLGLSAIREVNVGGQTLFVVGGRRLDRDFLASLEFPAGMRAMFYQNLTAGFSPERLIDASGRVPHGESIEPIIQRVQREMQERTALIQWSSNEAEDEVFDAIPLTGLDNQLLGILLVGNSQRPYVELRQHIRSTAFVTAAAGILLAILLTGWAAGRVTRPVEELANAVREVASGNWNTQVKVDSSGELAELAAAFNQMTRELLDHRERLVQAERVAAWRDLARRLAHELKNPLFPLQVTVENLVRARQQSSQQFEEIFQESSSTLLAEIASLKAIISRFSEFSKMPRPQFQLIQLNDVVQSVARLFQAQLNAPGRATIECKLELADQIGSIAADSELLHHAVSNLVLNALEAMPAEGTLTLRTRQTGDRQYLEVSDTGAGLTPEECERIFAPYYTSKTHGTGLGLAIVQSVASDHGGRISIRSKPGQGATFILELPGNAYQLQAGGQIAHTFGATQ